MSPAIDPKEIYPEATQSASPAGQPGLRPDQQAAIASSQSMADEANRPIAMRVKAVMIYAILIALSSAYLLVVAATYPIRYVAIVAVIGFIQLAIAMYLLFSKNQHTVALVLKIMLVLQLIGLFRSLVNPVMLVIDLVLAGLLFYSLSRVRQLSY